MAPSEGSIATCTSLLCGAPPRPQGGMPRETRFGRDQTALYAALDRARRLPGVPRGPAAIAGSTKCFSHHSYSGMYCLLFLFLLQY